MPQELLQLLAAGFDTSVETYRSFEELQKVVWHTLRNCYSVLNPGDVLQPGSEMIPRMMSALGGAARDPVEDPTSNKPVEEPTSKQPAEDPFVVPMSGAPRLIPAEPTAEAPVEEEPTSKKPVEQPTSEQPAEDPDLASQPCQSSLRRQSGKLYKMNGF